MHIIISFIWRFETDNLLSTYWVCGYSWRKSI